MILSRLYNHGAMRDIEHWLHGWTIKLRLSVDVGNLDMPLFGIILLLYDHARRRFGATSHVKDRVDRGSMNGVMFPLDRRLLLSAQHLKELRMSQWIKQQIHYFLYRPVLFFGMAFISEEYADTIRSKRGTTTAAYRDRQRILAWNRLNMLECNRVVTFNRDNTKEQCPNTGGSSCHISSSWSDPHRCIEPLVLALGSERIDFNRKGIGDETISGETVHAYDSPPYDEFMHGYRYIFLDYFRMPVAYLEEHAAPLFKKTLPAMIKYGLIGADTEIFLPNDISGRVMAMVTESCGTLLTIQPVRPRRNPLWIATEDSSVLESLGGMSNDWHGALKHLAHPTPWLRCILRKRV